MANCETNGHIWGPAGKCVFCPAYRDQSQAHTLCLKCRGTFTDAELDGASACPRCGNRGVPADTRKTGTATLTTHEWRVLCIWASNWADHCAKSDQEGYDSPATMRAIIRELRRQMPDAPAMTMAEEIQEVANAYGPVEVVDGAGRQTVNPETKQ